MEFEGSTTVTQKEPECGLDPATSTSFSFFQLATFPKVSSPSLCEAFVFFLYKWFLFSSGATAPSGPGPPQYRGFTITLRHTTLCRTPLDEWSARRRDLYLTKHNNHKRQTSIPPSGFEPKIPASERLQTPRRRPRGHWDRPYISYISSEP
jgi:hypothetical protein